MVLIWDLNDNCEVQSLDFDTTAFTFQDIYGNFYVGDKDKILITSQNIAIKSYDFEVPKQKVDSVFNLRKGQRMDPHDHNWILMTEYMCLSFSFMTLVIKDNLDYNIPKNGSLDVEAYNYNINRRTFLTCDNFVAVHSKNLKTILTFLEEIDPELL